MDAPALGSQIGHVIPQKTFIKSGEKFIKAVRSPSAGDKPNDNAMPSRIIDDTSKRNFKIRIAP